MQPYKGNRKHHWLWWGVGSVVILVLVIGLCGWFLMQQSHNQWLEASWDSEETASLQQSELAQTQSSSETEKAAAAAIGTESSGLSVVYVDVKGAVNHPGVYALPAGSRVFDAIEAAGGLQSDAVTKALNQAQLLADQMQVYVYRDTEIASQPAVTPVNSNSDVAINGVKESNGVVNINQATVEQLCSLPGIGQKKAEAIIAYRQTHGSFQSVEELTQVKGIGKKLLQQIETLVTIQ